MLKASPQDCPVSQNLQNVLFLLFLALSITGALSIYNLWGSLLTSVLDLAILYLFTQVLLSKKKERIHQTLNAFLGTGIIISIVSSISSYAFPLDPNTQTIPLGRVVAFYFILIWIVAAYGNIVKHATDTSLAVGMAISFGYVIVNMIVIVTFIDLLGIT